MNFMDTMKWRPQFIRLCQRVRWGSISRARTNALQAAHGSPVTRRERTVTDAITPPQPAGVSTPDNIASQLLAIIIQMEGLIPDLQPHNANEIAKVAATAKFAHELITPTITTVTSVPSVPQDLFKVERGRDALRYRDMLRPIAQRLAVFTQGLEFTIDSKLSDAGEDALQTYHWAKRAVNGPSGAALSPYLDEMRRVVKKAINRHPKKATSAPPSTPPAPQGQTFMAIRPPAEEVDGDQLPESYYKAGEDVS